MSSNEPEFWLFNTDETEPEGEGKHAQMLKKHVVAAWGYCKGLGAEVTLNRPKPDDVVFYFRAGHGIIARSVANGLFASPSQSIFAATGEYSRPVDKVQILPESAPVTVAEIKDHTGYQIPFRQIMGRILNADAVQYLNQRFQKIQTQPSKTSGKSKTGSKAFVQVDPAERKQVETAAVRVVTRIYEKAKWKVKSVEQENVGYDLHCTKSEKVECVEVKGRSGIDACFDITANELNKAKTDERFVLYLVTSALKNPVPRKYSAKQLIAKFDIRPTQFRATLKEK